MGVGCPSIRTMATSSQFIPVVKSELDFFKPKAVQTSQVGYETILLKPLNSVGPTSTRIEFLHPGRGADFYRNLSHTYFYIKFQVTKKSKESEAVTEDKYSVINYLGQTLIHSIEVQLNGTAVTRNSDNHAYRAYIESLLSCNKLDAECHLASAGFGVDGGKKVNEFDTANNALVERSKMVNKGKSVEFISKLHGDVFNSNLYLPNGIDLAVNINLNGSAFTLITSETTPDASLRILDCGLYTEICHINPAVMTAQARAFQEHNAIFPLQHAQVQAVTVAKGQRFVNIDNIFSGRLPSLILVALTDNTAFAGDMKTNPLCFKHYNLTDITISVNGIQHKIGPLDFSEDSNSHVMGYHQLLKATGLLYQSEAPILTLDRYKHGCCLFAADLSAEGSSAANGTHSSLSPVGNVRIEANFSTALSDAVTFIIYSVREGGVLEIDRNRSVFVSL